MNENELKEIAALKSKEYVPLEGFVGIGTGSTVKYLIKLLAEDYRKYSNVTFVPTSAESMDLLNAGGLKTSTNFAGQIRIDIDGADEIDPQGNLIKGGGSALTREKIVAVNSERLIVIADESKLVKKLGRFKIPVEILEFLSEQTVKNLEKLGCNASYRLGEKSRSDNGNIVVDLDFGLLDNIIEKEIELKMIPGVVEAGLFVGITWKSIIGTQNGAKEKTYK